MKIHLKSFKKYDLLKAEIVGIIFTIILGSLLHFIYKWSGNNEIAGLFSAVNESTWEHLKLLFMPYVLFGLIEFFVFKYEYKNIITSKTIGTIVGMLCIILLFYGYTAFIHHMLAVDIIIFIFGIAMAFAVSYYFMEYSTIEFNFAAFLILIILLILFFTLTFNPPKYNLFRIPPN